MGENVHSDNDCKKIQFLTHSLIGTASGIDLGQIRRIAVQIEEAARAADFWLISTAISDLEEQFRVAVEEIRKFMKSEVRSLVNLAMSHNQGYKEVAQSKE